MVPFLHLGPVTIPTFGLMVACAMFAAFFVLRADLVRRGFAAGIPPETKIPSGGRAKKQATRTSGHSSHVEAEILIAVPCVAGIIGAKLYHVFETPAELFAHPFAEIFTSYGFAWFGGLLAGFVAFVCIGRRQGVPLLTLLDVGSPAAALGYGIGRIGCLLSGDGDYGIPTTLPWGMSFPNGLVPTTERVHPTPIYEFIVACAIAWWLWRMCARKRNTASDASATETRGKTTQELNLKNLDKSLCTNTPGKVFAAYLVLTGMARFLVEFIRINPRSFFGMSNAQTAGLASTIVGAVLWWQLKQSSSRQQ